MDQSVVYLQEGGLAEVAGIVERLSVQRPFFVIDETAYTACGADAILDSVLGACSVSRFSKFELNPQLYDIERGVEQYREFNPDVVIALGGGTAIDLGKLIGALAQQQDSPRDLVIGKAPILHRGRPLIAIPTTAGTGSEATHFAVAYVDGVKYSVAHYSLLPDFAIVDPLLTHSLPASATSASGLDAFCQAIESIWAVGATDESVHYATQAVRLAVDHLVSATQRPTREAREGMCCAAHLAGKAINISKTTLPHALSYAITSDYGIAHGWAVAMTLSPVLAYNAQVSDSDCLDPRGPAEVHKRIAMILELLGAENVAAACDRVERLVAAVGCPASLKDIGIANDDELRRLIGKVNTQRMANNPRRASQEDLVGLLTE